MPSFTSLLSQQIADSKLRKGSIICLLDDDDEGRVAYKKINKDIKECAKPIKTISLYLTKKDSENLNYPKMIEDSMIPEVLFKSLKDFLKNKYKKINLKKFRLKDFTSLRLKMKKHALMEVADAFFNDVIESGGKGFSFKQLDVKYGVALKYAENIQVITQEEINRYKDRYPTLLSFLEQFKV